MKVHFVSKGGPHLASWRLRTRFAADALGASVGPDWAEADVHVFSKHWHPEELEWARRSPRAIFDLCDNHFHPSPAAVKQYPHIERFYREMCEIADTVTTGSEELGRVIRKETSRFPLVIEEPFETPELEPGYDKGAPLLWFGHGSNLKHLEAIAHKALARLQDMLVVSNHKGCIPWSPANLASALDACSMVIIPQTELWKSANRAVAAIRAGRYVLADPVDSYRDLGIWTGGVLEGLEWNHGNIIEKIRRSQRIVKARFHPKKIAGQWLSCISAAGASISLAS